MKRFFHNFFIPHKGNSYRPHSLRKDTLTLIVAFIVIIEIAFLAGIIAFKYTNFLAAVISSALVTYTNEERVNLGLPGVSTNSILENAARLKAEDMASKGYFAHTSPEGHSPWYWLDQAGYEYLFAGENLAVNFYESKDVTKAWMNSPTHRDNMVNDRYTEIGIATAEGIYKGKPATFVVQFFGRPRIATAKEFVVSPPANTSPAAAPAVSPGATPAGSPVAVAPAPASEPASAPASAPAFAPASAPQAAQNANQTNTSQTQIVETPVSVVRGDSLKPAVDFKNSLSRFSEKIASSPRSIATAVQLVVLAFLFISLILSILIKVKVQQPRAIAGAIIVMFLVGGLLFANNKIFSTNIELPTDSMSATVFNSL